MCLLTFALTKKDEMSIAAQRLSTNKNQDSVSVICAIDPIA